MLKSELIRPRLKTQDGQVWTRPLSTNYRYLNMASDLIALFQRYVGYNRAKLTEALRDYEGDSLDYPVIRGLAAVLEARCTFGNQPPIDPTQLRTSLFQQGPVTHKRDLFHQKTREQVLAETADRYDLNVEQIETALFADLAEEQVLLNPGEPISPGDLIARYNLELARGLLYWAREVRISVHGAYKDIFKYIKLFKLMYTIRPLTSGDGYHITLHGPLSPFVKSTIRYGLQFAKFLPALLLCEKWRMEADVQPPGKPGPEPYRYILDDRTNLRTHFKSSGPFDSQLEADFAAEFEAKYSGARRKWELAREDELIVVGDTVMIPDFSFTHRQDGRRALLEIVGFWHPNYLQRKLDKVRQAGREDLILLIYESVNVAEGAFEKVSAGEVLTFSRKPILKEVLAAVERCAVPPAKE
jgi:predicted nuclease of restriction endonuclease-like RecB superfamily